MKILLNYLKNYKGLLLALFLAAINQVFPLLDPHITGRIVDNFIEKKDVLDRHAFTMGIRRWWAWQLVLPWYRGLRKPVGLLHQHRGAKAGSEMYADGQKHSSSCHTRRLKISAGETSAFLQKVRTDSEKFITSFISVLFASLVGMVFVVIYSLTVSYKVTLVYFCRSSDHCVNQLVAEPQNQTVQKSIVKNYCACRLYNGIARNIGTCKTSVC